LQFELEKEETARWWSELLQSESFNAKFGHAESLEERRQREEDAYTFKNCVKTSYIGQQSISKSDYGGKSTFTW